jgi:HEAT repeat protein
VWAFARADSDEAVEILADVAKNDPAVKVRKAAIQVLGEIRTPAAQKALLEILEAHAR